MVMNCSLVLSGGGVRGLAHIGVLKALLSRGVVIDRIAGSSIGALVGVMYASCGDIAKVESFVRSLPFYKLPDLSFSRSGLLKGDRIRKLVAEFIGVETFEELKIPVVINATDLHTGEEVVISSGSLLDALRASIAYPGLLTPIEIDGRQLLDGGIVNPVPVALLPVEDKILISDVAVNLEELPKRPSIVETMRQAVGILQLELIRQHLKARKGSFVHLTPDVHEWGIVELRNDPRLIARGQRVVEKSWSAIEKLLSDN